MFVESRDESRQFFRAVWQKMARNEALEPLESVVASVIRAHPEYHQLLGQPSALLTREFDAGAGGDNPFLHLGLHVALIEQLQSDRPAGIMALYRQLHAQERDDVHGLEHRIIECLEAALWRAGSTGAAPDEQGYLGCVRRLLR